MVDRCTQGSMIKGEDYVGLGLTCAQLVCQAVKRGINQRRQKQLSQVDIEAIELLRMWIALAHIPQTD